MFIFIHVCMHTYIFVYIDTPVCGGTLSVEFYVCVYTCIYVHIYIHVLQMYSIMPCVCIFLHMCTRLYTRITNVQYHSMCVYIYTLSVEFYVCVYTCICVHIYIHVLQMYSIIPCVCIYLHTCTHLNIQYYSIGVYIHCIYVYILLTVCVDGCQCYSICVYIPAPMYNYVPILHIWNRTRNLGSLLIVAAPR